MMNDISSVMRFSFQRRTKSSEKSILKLKTLISKGESTEENTKLLRDEKISLQSIRNSQRTYQKHLRRLSTVNHPFAALTSEHQTAATCKKAMLSSLDSIRAIKEEFNIADAKNKFNRVKRQIPDSAKQVDNW